MTFLEAAAISIGDLVAALLGLILGKAFNLDPKKAKKVGELVIIWTLLLILLFITFIYS